MSYADTITAWIALLTWGPQRVLDGLRMDSGLLPVISRENWPVFCEYEDIAEGGIEFGWMGPENGEEDGE